MHCPLSSYDSGMVDGVAAEPCKLDIKLLTQALPEPAVLDEAISLLKGFADPTRLKILSLLREGEVCVHQIVEALEMTQSAVSHQLRSLRNARLVTSRKHGRHVYYRLMDEHVRGMLDSVLLHSREIL